MVAGGLWFGAAPSLRHKATLPPFHSPRASFRIRRIMVGPLIRYPSNIVETID